MDSSLGDVDPIDGHPSRARRAIAIAVLAVLVVGVAGFAYLRSGAASHRQATARPPSHPPVIRPGDTIRYEFVSSKVGWAAEATVSSNNQVGPFTIFRTQDGARSWQRQLSGQSAQAWAPLGTLQMRDKNNGHLIAGDPLQLYRTTDGGSHWRPSQLPTQDAGQLVFGDDTHAWIVAWPSSTSPTPPGPRLYSSSDGGNLWTNLPDPPQDLGAVAFRGPLEGWGSLRGPGLPGIYTSGDGGYTWKKHELPTPEGLPQDSGYSTYVQVLPDGGALAEVFYSALVFRMTSFDQGASWQISRSPTGNANVSDWSYAYQDSRHWWAVNVITLYKSSDAGQSWTRFTSSVPAGLGLLRVLDARSAWAESNEGSLYFTSDGGLHWTSANVPMPAK